MFFKSKSKTNSTRQMTLAIQQNIMLSFWVSQTNLIIEFKLPKKVHDIHKLGSSHAQR